MSEPWSLRRKLWGDVRRRLNRKAARTHRPGERPVDVAGAGWWNCSTCRGVVHRSALRRWRFPLKTTEYELSAISWSSTAATPIGIIGQNAETPKRPIVLIVSPCVTEGADARK